jgi:hypothetical protein
VATVVKDPRVNVQVDPRTLKQLKALAAANERSIAAECRLAILAHLDKAGHNGKGRLP